MTLAIKRACICIGSCLNFPVDTVAPFVICQYFDNQREPLRQGGTSPENRRANGRHVYTPQIGSLEPNALAKEAKVEGRLR